MKKGVTFGPNKTGIAISPDDAERMIEASESTPPSSPGSEDDAAQARVEVGRGAGPLGSVPRPATFRGAVKAAAQRALHRQPHALLLDKLGARLAFERTGTRLYEQLLVKHDARGGFRGGPDRAELEEFHDDELRHFEMVRQAIEQLGADPTAQTPGADVQGVASLGLVQVVSDPRTTLDQALEALLTAELTDVDSWRMLVDLAMAHGQYEMAIAFRVAEADEERHLRSCRRWVARAMMLPAEEKDDEEGEAA